MSWSRLKNIIIIILLLLNLFLLGLVGFIRLRSARYEASALSEAAAVLELNGIQVQRDGLPESMGLAAVTVARDTRREAALAAALLGSEVESQSSGGGLYVYRSPMGEASFRSNGEFSVTFSQSLPASDLDRSSQARVLLEGLDLEFWQVEEDGVFVTAAQALHGACVYSGGYLPLGQSVLGITFIYDTQGRLASASGLLLMGGSAKDSDSREPLSVPTALIAFFSFTVDNGEVCQAIRSMTPVYRASTSADPIRLTPVWRITTDTGDYFLDAYTAEVTRASPITARGAELPG